MKLSYTQNCPSCGVMCLSCVVGVFLRSPSEARCPKLNVRTQIWNFSSRPLFKGWVLFRQKWGRPTTKPPKKIASLERENLEFKALLRDLVSEQQATRVQQAKLAGAVSGVLDQFHGLDRRVENSTPQGALAVGVEIEVGQVREIEGMTSSERQAGFE